MVDFKVIYFTLHEKKELQVVRYDCTHGFPHKDVFYEKRPKKIKLPIVSYSGLFQIAMDDIQDNWMRYKRRFLRLISEEVNK